MSDQQEPIHQFGTPGLHFENSSLTRTEYITALVHFYRAEMHRATMWRMRLDTTTNWALVTAMGVVTFSFGDDSHTHGSLLAGMFMVTTFLLIEARRYRIFDVWRERTRMLELNFLAPILRGDVTVARLDWGRQAAEHLHRPHYTLSWVQAVRARLVRNYLPLYVLLLVCWFVKLRPPAPFEARDWPRWIAAMRVGPVPGEVIGAIVTALYLALIAAALFARSIDRDAEDLAHPTLEKSLEG